MREEKLRIQSMELLEKRFRRICAGGLTGRIGWMLGVGGIGLAVLGAIAVLFMVSGRLKHAGIEPGMDSRNVGGFVDSASDVGSVDSAKVSDSGGTTDSSENLGEKKEGDFYDRLTEVTESYYEAEIQSGNEAEKVRLCDEAETALLELRKQYRGKEEYRRLMEMLADNRELAGKEDEAALYYEEMIYYDGSWRDAYGEYGMFLLRMGQEDACRELWKDYLKKEKDGGLDDGASRNLGMWEKRMKEMDEKKKKDKKETEETKERGMDAEMVFPKDD